MLHTNPRIIGVPRVPKEHLSRPRLLERLDARTPLTVLRAPAGSGKSALPAEWAAAQARVSGAWFSVTVDDQERSALCATSQSWRGRCAERVGEHRGVPAAQRLPQTAGE